MIILIITCREREKQYSRQDFLQSVIRLYSDSAISIAEQSHETKDFWIYLGSVAGRGKQ
jgi:hypothetical protein